MRKLIVAANWKMNKTPEEAGIFVEEIKSGIADANADVYVFPPFLALQTVSDVLKDTDVKVGAQNMYIEDKGAYTGEISADMLQSIGINSVIIGHSERRQIFKESDEMVHAKLIKALSKGMTPILCCGEDLETRENNKFMDFINSQIKSAFADISESDACKVIIAYEPVWAIGTGKVATCEQAEQVCASIRSTIEEMYSKETADNIHILYGGSCNVGNAKELFSMPDIDGGLIGGAGLKPEFVDIVHCKEK